MLPTERFYTELNSQKKSLEELYRDEASFSPFPNDWCVLVADIKDSTQAVANNQHNEVNLAATGCIVAVLNNLKKDKRAKVPYFFGGDGATFLVPNSCQERLFQILKTQKNHVKLQWNLELVVGVLSLEQIYSEGYMLKVAKIQLNMYLEIPVILGFGLKYAEEIIKKSFVSEIEESLLTETPDLKGMECRWEQITPLALDNYVLCLLVYCASESSQRITYRNVLLELTKVFGSFERRQPISIPKLKLNATYEKIKREMLASIGKYSYSYILKALFETYIGKLYFTHSKAGKLYLKMTKELSETVMIDGTINTIVTGTMEQIKKLSTTLDQMESEETLMYGLHITHSAIMSCYVEDRQTEHAHFVDGTEGGYTQAAEMLKLKLVEKNKRSQKDSHI